MIRLTGANDGGRRYLRGHNKLRETESNSAVPPDGAAQLLRFAAAPRVTGKPLAARRPAMLP